MRGGVTVKVEFVREAPVVVVVRRVRPSSRTVAAQGVLRVNQMIYSHLGLLLLALTG